MGLDKKVVVFNMSGRKAELERKRKRLEEIKKAREEKKKVNIINWISLWGGIFHSIISLKTFLARPSGYF